MKPDNFVVPPIAANIHGITTEIAIETGIPIQDVFAKLSAILPSVGTIVAHNIKFDDNVLQSELHRYEMCDMVSTWKTIPKQCTMLMGVPRTANKKWPKLCDLYKLLSGGAEPMGKLHSADTDVALCSYCYFKMNK